MQSAWTAWMDDDYDTPWKEVVTRYFPEFMAFYFPDAHALIDWSRPYAFLDQELAALSRDAAVGKRLLDKLVRVHLRNGGEQWVLLHLEVQGWRDGAFAERIFTYHYRVYDRYRRPAKWCLTKLLYERRCDKQRIIDLYHAIDWTEEKPCLT